MIAAATTIVFNGVMTTLTLIATAQTAGIDGTASAPGKASTPRCKRTPSA